MRRITLAVCCLLVLARPGAGQPATEAEREAQLAELRKLGVEPTRRGVEGFLEPLRWTPAREAQVRALLADLGSDRYRTREKATAELLGLPHVPRPLLEEAARNDPEARRRVDRILEEARYGDSESKVLLVLRA